MKNTANTAMSYGQITMCKMWIKGYYGSYEAAYDAAGKKFKESRRFSIQMSNERKDHPWVLIYLGKD